MAIHKVIEVLSQSDKSWEDATARAVQDAAKTVKGIKAVYVKNLQADIKDNKIVQYTPRAESSSSSSPTAGDTSWSPGTTTAHCRFSRYSLVRPYTPAQRHSGDNGAWYVQGRRRRFPRLPLIGHRRKHCSAVERCARDLGASALVYMSIGNGKKGDHSMVGILVHGNNHLILSGRLPDQSTALAILRRPVQSLLLRNSARIPQLY
ncbi:MAG: dodecin family protein [Candidatus Korobacteraceae bacterium]